MKLQLNDDFRLSTVPYNFLLEQRKSVENKRTKKSKLKWLEVGHYPSIETALRGFARHSMFAKPADGIEEVKKLLIQINRDIIVATQKGIKK